MKRVPRGPVGPISQPPLRRAIYSGLIRGASRMGDLGSSERSPVNARCTFMVASCPGASGNYARSENIEDIVEFSLANRAT
jgi:hypothetical protein